MEPNGTEAAFERTVAQSYDSISRDSSDYEVGGILYCGKCNTPKQVRVTAFGKEFKPMSLCRCESERRKSEIIEREAAERRERILRSAFPSEVMRGYRFDTDDGDGGRIMEIAKRYADKFGELSAEGKGLVLYGSTGNGKTFAACAIANALIERGIKCRVTTMDELEADMRQVTDRAGYLDKLDTNELLVIDDFGTERTTSYMAEQVYAVINRRNQSRKPLILTTNLSSDEFRHPRNEESQRIYSRLFEMCFFIEAKGEDRRRKVLRSDMVRLGGLIGL